MMLHGITNKNYADAPDLQQPFFLYMHVCQVHFALTAKVTRTVAATAACRPSHQWQPIELNIQSELAMCKSPRMPFAYDLK